MWFRATGDRFPFAMTVTLASDDGTLVRTMRLQGEGQVIAWTFVRKTGEKAPMSSTAIIARMGFPFMTVPSASVIVGWFAGLRRS